MKCRIILELLAILFFTGCYNREQISRLDEAEALIQNKPDSALTILQQLKSEGSQAEQAKYALLYSEALDKNHIKATNDSLIRRAWEYYKHHPKDLRRQCKTLYYWGKVKLRTGDKPGALRLYLKVEEKLKDTNEPYYAGLLYSQIGEVYYDQMNYSRAYHYFREARNNFRQSDNTREETEATLDMAAATFNSKDMEKAMRLYSAALDLADEHKFDKLAKASLTNLASLYVVSGKKQIPHDLLQRIELSARQDTLYGYHTLVDVNLLKNRIDSARYYLALAEAHSTDIRDIADLQYTAYRIEAQARNFEKATEKIHHYIYLTDSLTRSNMQFSAGMVERDYFKERSNFAEYRMKNRTIWEIAVASVIFLILGVAYYIIRQRLLEMLHPFMPFITEELWQQLRERKPGASLMVTQMFEPNEVNEKFLQEFEVAKEIISNVRSIRLQKNIAMKEQLELQVVGSHPVEKMNPVIIKMCNLSSFTVVESKPEGAASFMIGTTEFAVPLGNMIDVKAEIARMEAELKHKEGFLQGVLKKLSNEKFVNNAPAAVLELERKKQADAESIIKSLKESIEALKKV